MEIVYFSLWHVNTNSLGPFGNPILGFHSRDQHAAMFFNESKGNVWGGGGV